MKFKMGEILSTLTTSQEEEQLKYKKKFILDYLIPERGGILGKLVPIYIALIFLLFGYVAGIFSDVTTSLAKYSFLFWVVFITVGMYVLYSFDRIAMRVVHEAELRFDIKPESNERLLRFVYGPVGIIIWILITLPFIIYDITGFGITEEGWLIDISSLDNTWYPGITNYPNGIGLSSILWLVVWEIPWFYISALTWLSLVYLIYVNVVLKNTTWKGGIEAVIRQNLSRKFLVHLFALYVLLAPYLVLKLIYQIVFEILGEAIWWSDTVATFLLFAVFFVGMVFSPYIITKDIEDEKLKMIDDISSIEVREFDETAKKILADENVDSATMVKALVLHLYQEEMMEKLTNKSGKRALILKIALAVIGPIASYGIKFILPLFGF